jgi:ferredoxin/flavodoxin
MNTDIFYFSGTGNSLVTAKELAKRLGGRSISIPSVMKENVVTPETEVVGIVFPAYYMHMPRIVVEFIGKLTDIKDRYLFAVVTVGGIAGDVFSRLSDALSERGEHIAAGFVIRMPANYIDAADAQPQFLQRIILRRSIRKIERIAEYVRSGKRGLIERRFNPVATFLFSKMIEKECMKGGLQPDIDKRFYYDDRCNGCGTCSKICPVGNIEQEENHPVWKHNCVRCFACIQWCPQQAIQFGAITVKRKRYHHPDVGLSDMIRSTGRCIAGK